MSTKFDVDDVVSSVDAKVEKPFIDLHISAPELSIGLPCNEQRRAIHMDVVTHDGFPKLELRRWRLDDSDARRRLDGVMLKFDEAKPFFEIIGKMVNYPKDRIVDIGTTLQLVWKGTELLPYLKCTRTYPNQAYQARTFQVDKDVVRGMITHMQLVMDVFTLMMDKYTLVMKKGTINHSGGKNFLYFTR